MLDPKLRFNRKGWYLVPGPLSGQPPIHTIEVRGIAEYDYPMVANAILQVPGTHSVHEPEPAWADWQARWESGSDYIEVDMFPDTDRLTDDSGKTIYSGGWLKCDCTVGQLAEFLRAIRKNFPGIWLCDGGDHTEAGGSRLHSPESFLDMPALKAK